MSFPSYHFVIVPKLLDPWYDEVWMGCQAKAKEYASTHNAHVECSYVGHSLAVPELQARILTELVTDPGKHNLTKVPDGVSVAVLDEEITGAAVDFVHDWGVPIITYDSDSPKSKRQAFVSTDNYAFGLELGKVLDQLNPQGGYFGMITGNGPNLVDRVRGVRDRLLHDPLNPTKWKEVNYSPLNSDNNVTYANELMHQYAQDERIGAVIPVGGWPMFDPTLWKEFVDQNRNIFTVVADSIDIQLELMAQGYVQGLVGQLPFQMGEFSARELFNINQQGSQEQGREAQEVLGTHMLEILRVPLQLPPITVNQNHIGNVAILGYISFGIVALSSIVAAVWVFCHSNSRVVRMSQPTFLYMICAGVVILGSAPIPLTIDDGSHGVESASRACMALPWLISVGFSTAFAALFSKTWRIYQLLKGAMKFQRVKVTVSDVMAPFVGLLLINIITLICWTILAPLEYVRAPDLGTDDWNRIIATHGSCRGKGGFKFFLILVCVNFFVLVMLNVYAYLARHIHTEYSESRYIALVNASMLQAAVIGLPIMYLVYDDPVTYFVVLTSLIFVTCMAILGFILFPKVIALGAAKRDQGKSRKTSPRIFGGGVGRTVVTSYHHDPSSPAAGLRFAVVDAPKEFDKIQKSRRQAESVVMARSTKRIISNSEQLTSDDEENDDVDISMAAREAVEDMSKEERELVHSIMVMFEAMSRNEREELLQKMTTEEKVPTTIPGEE